MKKFLLLTALSLSATSSFVAFDACGSALVSASAEDKNRQESLKNQVEALKRKIKVVQDGSMGHIQEPLLNLIQDIEKKSWYTNTNLTGTALIAALKEVGNDVAQLQVLRKAQTISTLVSKKPLAVPTPVNLKDTVERLSFDKLIETNSKLFNQNTMNVATLTALVKGLRDELSSIEFKVRGTKSTSGWQTSLVRWLAKNKTTITIAVQNADPIIKEARGNLKKFGQYFYAESGQNTKALSLETSPEKAKEILETLITDSKALQLQINGLEALKPVLATAKESQQAVKTALSDKEMFASLNKDVDTALVSILRAAGVTEIKVRKKSGEGTGGFVEETLDAKDIAMILEGPMNITMPKGLTPEKEKVFRENLKKFAQVVKAINEKFTPKTTSLNDTSSVTAKAVFLASDTVNSNETVALTSKSLQSQRLTRSHSWFGH